MIRSSCMVQEDQISDEQEATLRKEMEEFCQKSFDDSVDIDWIVVAKNSGFTAGVPSTSVLVSVSSNVILEKQKRFELLKELCDVWINTTGLSTNEVVGIITDPPN